LARARKRSEPDRFEREKNEFFDRARECYNALAAAQPQRFVRIDAAATLPAVRAATRDAIGHFVDDQDVG
jgi:dTMP kinase